MPLTCVTYLGIMGIGKIKPMSYKALEVSRKMENIKMLMGRVGWRLCDFNLSAITSLG